MSPYTSPTPAPGFLDPGDPTLFPRLTAAQIDQVAEVAEEKSFSPGEICFEQGQRDAPFFVVLSGAVDIIDRHPEGERYFTQCQPGTFIGDVAMFTGEPTIAEGVIAEETSLLVVSPDALRALVAGATELGDLLLRTMIVRREWLLGQGIGNEQLIGKRWSGDAFAIRELLERNLIPFSWHDIDTDSESQALLDQLGIGADECPVLVRTHNVLRGPTVTEVADELGLRAQVDQRTFDVVVLGAGPAGLASAVYASSEGLSTLVIERFAPGGQAGTSARIENYLGFPTGLSGSDLTRRATLQARKFGAVISSAHEGCRFAESTQADCASWCLPTVSECAPASSCSPSAPTIAVCQPTEPSASRDKVSTTRPPISRLSRWRMKTWSWSAAATRPGRRWSTCSRTPAASIWSCAGR